MINIPRRSMEEWMELVTKCRQSGLTDAAWCHDMGSLPAVFTMRLPGLRKGHARYQSQSVKQLRLILHPISRM